MTSSKGSVVRQPEDQHRFEEQHLNTSCQKKVEEVEQEVVEVEVKKLKEVEEVQEEDETQSSLRSHLVPLQ